MKDIPFMAIGNGELDEKKPIGKTVTCKGCGKKHTVKYGKSKKVLPDGTYSEYEKNSLLGFTNCGDKMYLVSIEGKKL